jgi:hypothetical protein
MYETTVYPEEEALETFTPTFPVIHKLAARDAFKDKAKALIYSPTNNPSTVFTYTLKSPPLPPTRLKKSNLRSSPLSPSISSPKHVLPKNRTIKSPPLSPSKNVKKNKMAPAVVGPSLVTIKLASTGKKKLRLANRMYVDGKPGSNNFNLSAAYRTRDKPVASLIAKRRDYTAPATVSLYKPVTPVVRTKNLEKHHEMSRGGFWDQDGRVRWCGGEDPNMSADPMAALKEEADWREINEYKDAQRKKKKAEEVMRRKLLGLGKPNEKLNMRSWVELPLRYSQKDTVRKVQHELVRTSVCVSPIYIFYASLL